VQLAGGDLTAMRWDGTSLHYEVKRTAAPAQDEVFVPDWAGALAFRCDGTPLGTTRDPSTGIVRVTCGTSGAHAVDAAP
jgi:hypothetical protein